MEGQTKGRRDSGEEGVNAGLAPLKSRGVRGRRRVLSTAQENNRPPPAPSRLRGMGPEGSHVSKRKAIGPSRVVCARPLATSGRRDKPIGWALEAPPG